MVGSGKISAVSPSTDLEGVAYHSMNTTSRR